MTRVGRQAEQLLVGGFPGDAGIDDRHAIPHGGRISDIKKICTQASVHDNSLV